MHRVLSNRFTKIGVTSPTGLPTPLKGRCLPGRHRTGSPGAARRRAGKHRSGYLWHGAAPAVHRRGAAQRPVGPASPLLDYCDGGAPGQSDNGSGGELQVTISKEIDSATLSAAFPLMVVASMSSLLPVYFQT